MRPWLSWLVLSIVVLVFGTSFALLGSVIGMDSPWLVLLLMFYFLGIAKTAEPLFRLRMPTVLHPLRRCERRGSVYRRLGVPGFGRLLRRSPLRFLNAAVYLGKGHKDPLVVRGFVEAGEASHFWAAVLFTPYVVLAGARGEWRVAAWFSLAQVLVNIYPILHLRHVRGRLDRTIRRLGRRADR